MAISWKNKLVLRNIMCFLRNIKSDIFQEVFLTSINIFLTSMKIYLISIKILLTYIKFVRINILSARILLKIPYNQDVSLQNKHYTESWPMTAFFWKLFINQIIFLPCHVLKIKEWWRNQIFIDLSYPDPDLRSLL